ncbi:hypothetical protein GI374_10605 [Paracoccus sp. S-4012]|uniref:hypothetical protein n=1 Tax=Paracoccus sp. S-4012 TaxID=2665648 RepID=UPI0012AF9B11|nr:hypothetical protein [Paracoccus sp. S-4012]MRX50889.1 hypothetical protein [Paracoccus sp. S-4012]
MARPRKTPERKRQKWAVLNVTPAERGAIEEAAAAAGQPTGRFIIARTLSGTSVVRADWQQSVAWLGIAVRLLEEIAAEVRQRAEPIDALRIALDLRRVEAALTERVLSSADEAGSVEC